MNSSLSIAYSERCDVSHPSHGYLSPSTILWLHVRGTVVSYGGDLPCGDGVAEEMLPILCGDESIAARLCASTEFFSITHESVL